MKILVTGGTTFAGRYTAEYFVSKGHEVYVLNRNSRPQSKGVRLIEGDRHDLNNKLKEHSFDAVLDITAYTGFDTEALHKALGDFGAYILVSSSAVYPETLPQPFKEEQKTGINTYWGDYGTNKIAAEEYVLKHIPNSYIIRPPYLYGKMNNLYREAFVFDCAESDRPFYVPKDGKMPLQFFDIEDMCRFMELLLEKRPEKQIYNVGNPEPIDICRWAELCYGVFGKKPRFEFVDGSVPQRSYFPFIDYGYILDVSRQNKLLTSVKPMELGLEQSYKWYRDNRDQVRRKPLIEFIDEQIKINRTSSV